MNRIKKYFKVEADVEIMACVHGGSIIFIYGLLQWFAGVKSVLFAIIFQQMLLGYIISWTQKGLFLKEKSYTDKAYRVRECLWCLLPILEMLVISYIFQWFVHLPDWTAAAFYGAMTCYFIMLWWFVKHFYQEETREMNRLLKQRKKEET